MTPLAIVRDGQLDWQYDGQAIWQASMEALEGKWVQVPLPKPVKKPKTQQQLAYYYAVCLPIAHREMLELGWDFKGIPVSLDMADHYLKATCGKDLYTDGKFSKAGASKDDMIKFIDRVIMHVSVEFNAYIPEPTK